LQPDGQFASKNEFIMEALKVLIPTDFSVQADYAYILVKKLEEKMPVEVHFLHVLEVPDTVTMNSVGIIETCGEIDVDYVIAQRDIAQRKLSTLKVQYGDGVHTHLVLGKLTDKVVRFAKDQQFDLIAMGTKGAWGLKEKVSGSEAQVIARYSEVPLLSLMCDRSDLEIKNILMVHNFSQPEVLQLGLLKKLITAFNPTIHLLQIVDKKTDDNLVLNNMKAFASINGIENFQTHLLKDQDIEQGVIHFNQMHDTDVVCIGTHGKKGFERLLHPSATEKLINHLFKPIISFHI
jgi:nucleotide-binding universal stress UspA family protein